MESKRFPRHPYLKVEQVSAHDSKGCTWARHKAQKLFQNEDFTLQIDSHMRAVKDWDKKLLQTWNDCKDPMAILSVYPNAFRPPNTPVHENYLHFNPVTGLVTCSSRLTRYRMINPKSHGRAPLLQAALFGRNYQINARCFISTSSLATRPGRLYSPNRQILGDRMEQAAAGSRSRSHEQS